MPIVISPGGPVHRVRNLRATDVGLIPDLNYYGPRLDRAVEQSGLYRGFTTRKALGHLAGIWAISPVWGFSAAANIFGSGSDL